MIISIWWCLRFFARMMHGWKTLISFMISDNLTKPNKWLKKKMKHRQQNKWCPLIWFTEHKPVEKRDQTTTLKYALHTRISPHHFWFLSFSLPVFPSFFLQVEANEIPNSTWKFNMIADEKLANYTTAVLNWSMKNEIMLGEVLNEIVVQTNQHKF